MSKIKKNGGLDQYDPERFGRLILLQSEKCGTERVNEAETGQKNHSKEFNIVHAFNNLKRLRETVLARVRTMKYKLFGLSKLIINPMLSPGHN